MTTVQDGLRQMENGKQRTCSFYTGTLGGHASTITFPLTSSDPHPPTWETKLSSLREQYDIDYDMGGNSLASIWGLASYRSVIAVALTLHPTDMIEYQTVTSGRCALVFSSPDGNIPKTIIDRSLFRQRRSTIYGFVLTAANDGYDYDNIWSQRLMYSAAVCALVEHVDDHLVGAARNMFERLAEKVPGADLSEEIVKSSSSSSEQHTNAISTKSDDQLNGPGGYLFERCDICDAGIPFISGQAAQCEAGHLFGMYLHYLSTHCLLRRRTSDAHETLIHDNQFDSAMRINIPLYPRTGDIQVLFHLRDRVPQ